ncbi:MAG: hypothetical protein HKN26_10040, partial [Acidimicrobiales bacterium]|nr:hypothetical protein [Acidimicrobiales bacterium]
MRRFLLCLLVAALVAASCGDDASSGDSDAAPAAQTTTTAAGITTSETTVPTSTTNAEPPTSQAASAELRVLVYNAGLAEGFVAHAVERQPLVAQAVADSPADIVFLQEVWSPEAVADITAATDARFPHQVFPEPIADEVSPEAEPSCTVDELADLEGCVATNCADASPDELVDCVLNSCGAEFAGLCAECQACIGSNVGSTVEEAVANCTAASAAFAYEGSVGLGLLSSAEILATEVLVLDSSLNRRAVVYALVDTEAFGEVHLFGTHLSAVFTDIPYPGEGTWEDEQASQIEAILTFIDGLVVPGEPVVLLGDFNTGPAGDGYEAEIPANYEQLAAAFPLNPYVAGDARCTFCGDNPLVGSGA